MALHLRWGGLQNHQHQRWSVHETLGLLVSLKLGDILIDEIHRLSLNDGGNPLPCNGGLSVDITIGKGSSAKTQCAAATVYASGSNNSHGALTSPLRDRFGLIQRLRFYEQMR